MERIVTRIAWVIAAFVTGGVIILLVVGPPGDSATTSVLDWAGMIFFALIPSSFAITSAAILSRQPRNVVGWALMIPAVSFVSSSLIATYFGGLTPVPVSLSSWELVALIFENFGWALVVFPLFHLMMVFPNGTLLSPRWRILVALEAIMILTIVMIATFTVEIGLSDGAEWTVPNPIGFIHGDTDGGLLGVAWAAGLVLLTIFGILALVVRFRGAGRVERQQIKWVLIAVVNFGVTYIAAAALSGFAVGRLADTLLGLSVNFLAVAIAFGVLRYRLFEIDRFVSRTVGYALVIGLLTLLYATGAVWLPSQIAADSPLFVAGSTLAVAAAFNPARRAILHGVDRRFFRAHYDMELLVDAFGGRVRDQTDVQILIDDWMSVVTDALQPSSVGVWIRE